MNVDKLGLVGTELELLRQVICLVEGAPSREVALEVLRRLQVALEAEYIRRWCEKQGARGTPRPRPSPRCS